MEALEKLKGRKVIARIDLEDGRHEDIEGTVLDIQVDDFYFYDKDEPVYIHVNVKPSSKLPEGVYPDDLQSVPLSNIRRGDFNDGNRDEDGKE